VIISVIRTKNHLAKVDEYVNSSCWVLIKDNTEEKDDKTMIAQDKLPSRFFNSKKKKLLMMR
jgi:hypothetical protein